MAIADRVTIEKLARKLDKRLSASHKHKALSPEDQEDYRQDCLLWLLENGETEKGTRWNLGRATSFARHKRRDLNHMQTGGPMPTFTDLDIWDGV